MQALGLGLRVGVFLLVGVLSLGYLFTRLGEVDAGRGWGYAIHAEFANASGLKPGSIIEIAGVPVGQVGAVRLDGTRARVTLKLPEGVALQDDAIASIQTKGLLGERYVVITPGASERNVPPGGTLRDTESPLDLPGLLSLYVNSRGKKATASPSNPPSGQGAPRQ